MTEQQVLDMIVAGHSVEVIVQRSSWLKWDVTELAKEYGYEFDKDGAPHRLPAKPKPVRRKQSGLSMQAMQ